MRLLIVIFISFYPIKTWVVFFCLMQYWLVDLPLLFAQALIMLIRTSLGLFSASNFYFYRIISHDDTAIPTISLHTASAASNSELWQLSCSAELFGNFKFCSLFRGPFVTPITHSRLNVKERGRDLICWRLPPISFKRLLIDNGKGERWTLNRHSNYRL